MTNSTLVACRMALERGQGRGCQNYKQSSVIIRFNKQSSGMLTLQQANPVQYNKEHRYLFRSTCV